MTSQTEATLGRALRLLPIHPTVGAAAGLDVDLSAGSEVRGAEALAQALTLAMVTLRGSDLFDERFGFGGLAALAGEADPMLRRERLRLAVIDVLRAEPRIRRIVSVRLGDAEERPIHAEPGSRVLEVLAEFETAAGTRQAAMLSGEVANVR